MRIPKTKYEILNEYGDLTIWTLALGFTPTLGSCCSPFRIDKKPSGSFYLSRNGYVRFKDFTTGDNYGAIDAYEILKNKSFQTIPEEINNITVTEQQKIKHLNKKTKNKKSSKVKIDYRQGNWTESRLDYWCSYGIDEEILREEVVPIISVDIKKPSGDYALHTQYHCYGYKFDNTGHIKIYQPNSKTHKFIGNTTKNDIYGYHSMEGYDLVVITSSGKDYLLLKSLRDTLDLDFDVLAPNGEGYVIPEHYRNKFIDKQVLLYYDNDIAGIKNAERHKSIYNNSRYIHNPFDKPKDPSDWSKYNQNEFIDFFQTELQWYL